MNKDSVKKIHSKTTFTHQVRYPDGTFAVVGLFWHVHHDELIEWCHDLNGRKVYIEMNKEFQERPLRLKLLQPVQRKGAPQWLHRLYLQVGRGEKSRQWCLTAFLEKKELGEINRLHAKQCPGCPWRNDTIFHRHNRKTQMWA